MYPVFETCAVCCCTQGTILAYTGIFKLTAEKLFHILKYSKVYSDNTSFCIYIFKNCFNHLLGKLFQVRMAQKEEVFEGTLTCKCHTHQEAQSSESLGGCGVGGQGGVRRGD